MAERVSDTLKGAADTGKRAGEFVMRHKKGFLIVIGLFLMFQPVGALHANIVILRLADLMVQPPRKRQYRGVFDRMGQFGGRFGPVFLKLQLAHSFSGFLTGSGFTLFLFEGRFQAVVLAPLRGTDRMLTGMTRTTQAAVRNVRRLERTAEENRGRRERASFFFQAPDFWSVMRRFSFLRSLGGGASFRIAARSASRSLAPAFKPWSWPPCAARTGCSPA